jgi:hypothetical protein
MASETTNINLDVFNVVGDGNMDFQTWSQKVAGEVDSNMVKIDNAIGGINETLVTVDTALNELSNRPTISNRQGGSATDWSVDGNNNYALSSVAIQVGTNNLGIPGGATFGTANITFPVPFANKPLVYATATAFDGWITITNNSATGTTIMITVPVASGLPSIHYFNWMAIGPAVPA